jgi:hypothetical protein
MQQIKDFLKEFESLDLIKVASKTKYADEAERGIDGEVSVREILSKYADELYQSVVIWDRKHEFTTEMDFVCLVNGYFVLVDAKEWFGDVYLLRDTKVKIKLVNASGNYKERVRTNPVYSITAFYKDTKKYLAPDYPTKEEQLKRIVVFTRDELRVKTPLADSSTILCKLSELEGVLAKIKNAKNEKPYKISKPLPSWDYYYSEEEQSWFKTVVMNNTIKIEGEDVPIKEINSILFNDDNKATILFKDGTVITNSVDKRDLLLVSNKLRDAISIKFIKFDEWLHD